jgi:PPOX class probable F420-dependent enzyme
MDERELTDFLAANKKVQVATNGPDGFPHLTTLFYALDGGRLVFWTYRRSQKIANLRRDPRVTCLVEDGEDYFELRGATIRGTARLVEDYDEVLAIGRKVAAVMADGADLGELGEQVVTQQARKRVAVVVEPEKTATWDHAKMSGPPGAAAS